MAKRKPTGKDNLPSMDHNAFRVDETTPGSPTWYRAVCDEIGHEKLDAILRQLGGSTDTIPVIYNVNIINSGTEYSQTLPSDTKKYLIRSRNKGSLRLAYTLGGTNTTYLTLPTGTSYVDSNFYSSITLYFQSTKPGDILEIVAYT